MTRFFFAGVLVFAAVSAGAQSSPSPLPNQPGASAPQPGAPAPGTPSQPARPPEISDPTASAPAPPAFAPGNDNSAPAPAKVNGPIRISGGVMAANKLHDVRPVYPSEARDRGPNGAVVLRVIIAKSGEVKDVSVISGPSVMAKADADAVRLWTYKPYLLNGEPVEVSTTVTMNVQFNSSGASPR